MAVLIQAFFGLTTGNWRLPAVATSMFFIGREITQAEYRWIAAFGDGRRANMPWWGGFDPAAWTQKALLDMLLPVLATLLVAVAVTMLRRR